MSIKIKVPLTILAVIVFNILILGGYFQWVLSKELHVKTKEQQEALITRGQSIVAEVVAEDAPEIYLERISQEQDLAVTLQSVSGEIVFETSGSGMPAGFSYSSIVQTESGVYILSIQQLTRIDSFTMDPIVQQLLLTEIIISFIITALLAGIIHLCFTRDVVALKKDINLYEQGITPQYTKRRDEVGQVRNFFVKLTETLEDEKQKRNHVIASISHDVKTPLTSIMAYTERLKKGGMELQRQQKYLDTIYSKSKSIQHIIEEFDQYLGFSMQGSLKKQRCSAQQMCKLVLEDYSEELDAKGISFIVECKCPDAVLDVDIAKLRRVFGNLIENSVKYAETGNLKIFLRCEKQNGKIRFSVSDNGKGVHETELKMIFEPLYTTDQGRSVSGFGLSICKSIIQLHGGEIVANNNSSGGLTITFIL